jgi:hypothetical protein
LPDGLVSDQNSQFGYILEGLAIEDVGVFYAHLIYLFYGNLIYFMAIWYIFQTIWYIFWQFGVSYQEKSGNPVFKSMLNLEKKSVSATSNVGFH